MGTNLTRTPASAVAAERRKFTYSCWIKKCENGKTYFLLSGNRTGSSYTYLIFQTDNTALASDEGEIVNISDANARNILGFVNVSNYTDLVGCQVATKTNIGLVVKAASTTKSIFVHAVNRSGGTYTPAATTDLKMKIGIVKD